jgi:hypothetical protein
MVHFDTANFVWGLVGAVAPEVLRGKRLRENALITLREILGTNALMIVLSGLFAVAIEPKSAIAAIYVGLSTPFIVSMLVNKAARDYGKGEGGPAAQQPLEPTRPPDAGHVTEVYERAGNIAPTPRKRAAIISRALLR